MNYYDEIKNELINNEINKEVKDYSKNKYELQKYYNVGKLLLETGNQYGENIIKEYSKKLSKDLEKNNFIVECDANISYISDIADYLESEMRNIMDFFELSSLSSKKKSYI